MPRISPSLSKVGARDTRYPSGSSYYLSHVYEAKLGYALSMGDQHSKAKVTCDRANLIRLEGASR
jgi:hypothetical protein